MSPFAASLDQARKSRRVWFVGLSAMLVLWFVVYEQLLPFAQWLVAST